jgi:HSP20 family protein
MVAGVRPEDITIESTRDTLTITGSRREPRSIGRDQYVNQELYWGSFSRVISLPEEVDADQIEASEKHGLLFIRLPKLDKHRQTRIKIKPF